MTYTKEPGYIYIVTSDDKRKYQPKADSDEVWFPCAGCWKQTELPHWGFSASDVYRRKIADVTGKATDSPWLPCHPSTVLPADVTNDTHIIEVYSASDGHRQLLEVFAFGYRDSDTTHYRLIELVAPPAVEKPEPTQQEKDLDAYEAALEECLLPDMVGYRMIFKAGAKYAREAAK